MNNIKNYCLNCNKYGHISKKCTRSIVSYGVICFNINNLKNISLSALYVLLKHNESNLNKLASITTTINLSRTNLENFEIKSLPVDIQENMIKTVNEYDNINKSLFKNMESLVNTNIFKIILINLPRG